MRPDARPAPHRPPLPPSPAVVAPLLAPPPGADALAARARDVLARVQDLERDLLVARTLDVHRIEEAAGVLDRLQGAIAVAAVGGDLGDLAALRGARRSVAEALILVLDLLERLRPVEPGR